MSNWKGKARSNYFKVKDSTAFETWAESIGLGLMRNDDPLAVAIYSHCPDTGAWPNDRSNEETGDDEDFDLYLELAPHLVEGEVAILMEAGAEKLRYITGNAVAVAWDGRTTQVQLSDIYEKVHKEFGITPTEASY